MPSRRPNHPFSIGRSSQKHRVLMSQATTRRTISGLRKSPLSTHSSSPFPFIYNTESLPCPLLSLPPLSDRLIARQELTNCDRFQPLLPASKPPQLITQLQPNVRLPADLPLPRLRQVTARRDRESSVLEAGGRLAKDLGSVEQLGRGQKGLERALRGRWRRKRRC